MELQEAIRRRRMVRAFTGERIDRDVLERIVANALHAPSAGFSQGWAFVVLDGPEQVRTYWECVAEPEWLAAPTWEGLTLASTVILPFADKQAYLDRYREPDKAAAGMRDEDSWPVPYWYIDTGMATLLMLLTAVDAGLGAVFVGIARGEAELCRRLGVPEGTKPIGAVLLGHRAPDRRSPSLARGRKGVDQVVHWGGWGA
jgi:nitroreductase